MPWSTDEASLQTVKLWSLPQYLSSLPSHFPGHAGYIRCWGALRTVPRQKQESSHVVSSFSQMCLLGGGIYLGCGFIGFSPPSCGPGYVGRMERMEGELFHLMVDRKGEGGEKEGGNIYIPKNPPRELLPPIRPHFLNFPPVPTHHHQPETRYLRQEPVGDISYSTYNNICLHLDPGILFFFKTRSPLRLGHKRKKVKGIRGQITNSVPCIEGLRHMQRLRKQPKGRSIL